MKSYIFYAVALVLLSSCGGGGDDDDGLGMVPAPIVQDPTGIWSGVTSTPGNSSSDTLAFFNDGGAGEFVAIYEDFNEFDRGTWNTSEPNQISSTGGATFETAGPRLGNSGFEGVVTSQGTLRARLMQEYRDEGDIDLVYEAEYSERSISLADLAGSWSASVPGLSFTITISPSGSFAASGSDGCSVSGELIIPHTDRNIFRGDELRISGSNCPYNGDYTGLGVLVDNFEVNDTLVIAYYNRRNGFAYFADRN